MTHKDLIEFFGSQAAAARAIGIKPPSVADWKANGIPYLRQLHIERVTFGKLRAENRQSA